MRNVYPCWTFFSHVPETSVQGSQFAAIAARYCAIIFLVGILQHRPCWEALSDRHLIMGTEALPPVGPGLEYASPELLTLLNSIEDEMLNNPLLKQEVPASAGTVLDVEEAPNDAITKDKNQARGAKNTSKKEPPRSTDKTAPATSTLVTADPAAVPFRENPKPEVEDEFDQQIKAVQAEVSHTLYLLMHLSTATCQG